MDLEEKLAILADGAKYDSSCASSGAKTELSGGARRMGMGGICHSWSADGRCISLLKILQTNICVYDCAYCLNRRSNQIRRALFSPGEIAELTVKFYTRNYIEGLFLSSAVIKNPDYTMELIVRSLTLLRRRRKFGGYIHAKLIPGASPALVDQAAGLADRVSVNVELPTERSLKSLAPQKTYSGIFTPMRRVSETHQAYLPGKRKRTGKRPFYSPAGQSTQLIIGATPETDRQIMQLAGSLYKTMRLKRVYYSAYLPVNSGRNLPSLWTKPPLEREHRLYQADWLLRYYGFDIEDLFDQGRHNLDKSVDPKAGWALRHLELFPVEINTAPYEELLRVPGIGISSAKKIVFCRKVKKLRFEDLGKLRIVIRRARHFITVNGRYYGENRQNPEFIRQKLLPVREKRERQMVLFPVREESVQAAISGEL